MNWAAQFASLKKASIRKGIEAFFFLKHEEKRRRKKSKTNERLFKQEEKGLHAI